MQCSKLAILTAYGMYILETDSGRLPRLGHFHNYKI